MTSDQWKAFIDVLRDLWKDNEFTRQLLVEVGDIELAIGIYGGFGDNSINWLHSGHLSTLGMRPLETLSSDVGVAKLKDFLMRVHG
ncbi:hypothetical protein [Variovorax sp. DT-64]|uniref:hypothetical protein n=1 Tax=Variovorax sp. DT-64 TaxID=3396160 RepID=UPI003F1A4ACB